MLCPGTSLCLVEEFYRHNSVQTTISISAIKLCPFFILHLSLGSNPFIFCHFKSYCIYCIVIIFFALS